MEGFLFFVLRDKSGRELACQVFKSFLFPEDLLIQRLQNICIKFDPSWLWPHEHGRLTPEKNCIVVSSDQPGLHRRVWSTRCILAALVLPRQVISFYRSAVLCCVDRWFEKPGMWVTTRTCQKKEELQLTVQTGPRLLRFRPPRWRI